MSLEIIHIPNNEWNVKKQRLAVIMSENAIVVHEPQKLLVYRKIKTWFHVFPMDLNKKSYGFSSIDGIIFDPPEEYKTWKGKKVEDIKKIFFTKSKVRQVVKVFDQIVL